MPKVKQNINSSSNVEQLRKVKQIVKQNSNIAGVPGGIRTHAPLLRSPLPKVIVHKFVNSLGRL